MTAEFLIAVGVALYGSAWHAPLAAALKVTPRTMRRWANDDADIPSTVGKDLDELCSARIGEILLVQTRLRRGSEP